jgi:hypothetical protein
MRIDIASHLSSTEDDQQQTTLIHSSADELKGLHVIQIEPEDEFESILMALRLQSEPVILLLPEQSQAFSDPAHFEQLRQICTPDKVSLVLPKSRIKALARYAHQYGFSFASSVEKAAQLLPLHEEEEHEQRSEAVPTVSSGPLAGMQPETNEVPTESTQEHLGTSGIEPETIATQWPPQSVPSSPQTPPVAPARRKLSTRRVSLLATMVALVVIAGAVLLPALFSEQPGLMQPGAVPAATTVGQIAFTSSGQLDPSSSKGLNDIVTVSLSDLSAPTSGNAFYAWLMPDKSDDTTRPLLLGKLSIKQGKAQLTYAHPDHQNLLASYSGFLVTEQESNPQPMTSPLNPQAWRYVGSVPNTPTPGDEQHFSLLSHMRHLLAKDPDLQKIGLQGGLDIWLFRNAGKIFEWSNAARDSWAGGQQTDLIHRHMIRILDYLDGAYVYNSGDVPLGSPLLVDPKMGRIGLLEVSQTQALPAYLTHVDLHLNGLANSPGHTEAQRQLAFQIDTALKKDMSFLQAVRQDAVKLVKMDDGQLKSNEALSLLNDMVINATNAYTGQLDPKTGGNINGIVWVHSKLQGLATMPVTTPPDKNE